MPSVADVESEVIGILIGFGSLRGDELTTAVNAFRDRVRGDVDFYTNMLARLFEGQGVEGEADYVRIVRERAGTELAHAFANYWGRFDEDTRVMFRGVVDRMSGHPDLVYQAGVARASYEQVEQEERGEPQNGLPVN